MFHSKKLLIIPSLILSLLFSAFQTTQALTFTEVVNLLQAPDINLPTGVTNSKGNIGTPNPGGYATAIRGSDDTATAGALWVSGQATGTPGLMVRNDGNVGIGTASPWSKLDIQGGYIKAMDTGGASAAFMEGGSNTYFGNLGTSDIYIGNSAASYTAMVIKNGGNVGIGTASPGARLHILADPQTTFPMYIWTADDNDGATKNPYAWQYAPGLLISNDWDGTAALVNSTKVAKIVLNTGAGGYNNGASIHVEGAGGYDQGQLIFSTGWNSSALATERLRINATGNIIIKTLVAAYTNGSAFVCVNNSGQLYASESACP